jgi:LPXTG-motif cell wall-anchored protein
MKKSILILSLAVSLLISNFGMATAQEKPKPKKDTVNIDTEAKPTMYYAIEDEKPKPPVNKSNQSTGIIVMIVGAVIIIGATAFFMMKKKKK